MYAEFHTTANSLDESFLKGLKAMFNNKPISIYVEEDLDETEYLLRSPANRKMLEGSLKSKEGYEYTLEEFRKFTDDLKKGRSVNMSKVRKVKIPE